MQDCQVQTGPSKAEERPSIAGDKPIKVLLLDDSAAVHQRVKTAFQGTKIEVTATDYWYDVQKQVFSGTPPDLLILDLQMPAINGGSVCRAIKRRVSTPVLFFSSESQDSLREAAGRFGADGALSKEASNKELVDTVKKLLRVRHAA